MSGLTERNYFVYACQEMEDLAREICSREPNRFQFRQIHWKYFPDGTPNIFFEGVKELKKRDVLFLASFSDYRERYVSLAMMLVFARSHIHSLTVLLPFFPCGTMERVDVEGQVATADVDSWLLSSIPKHHSSPTDVIIYDIHTLQNRFYFHDGALATMAKGMPIFKREVLDKLSEEERKNIVIAFPDDGSKKRFGVNFEKHYDIITCGKVREGDKRIVKITDGDPTGRHVYIIDDLVQTGGTLIECMKTLVDKGAAKVSAFVTHVVFPQESWRKFLPGGVGDGFENFYTTNTCPRMANIINKQGPFKVLSIGDDVLKYLIA